MPECERKNKLFGRCRFYARYSYPSQGDEVKLVEALADAMNRVETVEESELIAEAVGNKIYVGDICWCGKWVKPEGSES
jgi:hypothetical protein